MTEIKPAEEAQSGHSTSIKLSPRELEVLKLVAEGHSNKGIADKMGCAKRTIDFHIGNIYKKLEVSNRLQSLRKARKNGLLTD